MYCIVFTMNSKFPTQQMEPLYNKKGELLSSGTLVKNCVSYFPNLKTARRFAAENKGDLSTRERWNMADMKAHAERMIEQGKTVFAWWMPSKMKFAWGKAKNPAKDAYKAKQSTGRRDRWENEQFNQDVDALGELVLYTHQFTLVV